MQISNQIPVNLTGGPLSYRYRFHEIHIHYGLHDQFGSEHSVEGYTFPAEVKKNIFQLLQQQRTTMTTKLYSTFGNKFLSPRTMQCNE